LGWDHRLRDETVLDGGGLGGDRRKRRRRGWWSGRIWMGI